MNKILLWGTGQNADEVFKSIIFTNCKIIGAVDSDTEKQGLYWKNEYKIYSPEQITNCEVDYIIVSITRGKSQICRIASDLGIEKNKLIFFWDDDCSCLSFIDSVAWENQILKAENSKLKLRAENARYEYGEKVLKIKPANELLNHIIAYGDSLCRFGDGEFDIIFCEPRAWFQDCNTELGNRLKDILKDNNSKVIVAVADNYGNLDKYTEDAADSIRRYMIPEKRKKHMEALDVNREYYDAYVSRPYMIYKDKNANAKEIFSLYKRLFKERDIIIVEGRNTKTGIGNDLFNGANQVRRILCPDVNAYEHYYQILRLVIENAKKSDLILITLGPTATVLAYDLALEGYQAIDFGQVDNEYEWYLMQATEREVIQGKSVSELGWYRIPKVEKDDLEYERQIIARIEGI